MPKPLSRKFISPAFSGEKVSDENGERKENSSRKKEKAIPKSLSNSQYEEIFTDVIKRSGCSSENSYADDDSVVEDYVAIPEPNAALSPHEKAEEMNRDVINHGSMTITETPRNPIDNSTLPPLKKKKLESRIKKLGLKLKPTRLNFDDPELRGKPEKMLKPLETDTLTKSTSKKHAMSNITSNKEKLENTKSLPDKETSKQKAIPSKKKGENEETFLKPFVSRKFQSHQAATGKGEEQKKMSSHDPVIPSSNLSSVSNLGSLSLPQSTPKTFQFGSQESCSPESKILSPRSRLLRLQTKRNVGLWVQCSKRVCSKWRYLANTSDPSEVPDKWQCCMNDDDKYACCEAPECGPTPLEEEDLIHNIYNAGSLVWAHLAGFPWWPAMVDDDPDVEQYYWITEYCDIPTHYNVTFFDEKSVTRAWLTPGALTKFVNNEKRKDFQKMSANGIDYSQRIKVAIEQANEAAKLSMMERLKKFSFVSRYNGPIGKKRRLLDSPKFGRKKAKKSKREEKRTETDSIADSQASIQRSLEVVKEVNEVLSQITSDSESDGSEEDPQIDLNKSLEEVNEVLSLLSDCESLDLDDDQLEQYLESAQKESSVIQEEKSASKSKKKFTKPSVITDKGKDKHKDKNRRKYSIKNFVKRKHGMGLSSGFKETKSGSKGSSSMGNEKAEKKEKSKDRRHEYKDKRENLHHLKDSTKVQSEMVQSSSPKESRQKLKRADNYKSEGREKDKGSSKEGHGKHEVSPKEGHKETSKEGHEVPRETKKKNSGSEKTKVSKQGVSDVAQKKLNSDSKKETGSKEKKGNSEKTETTSKKKDGRSKKDEESRDDNRKQKKGGEIGKDKSIERSEGKTKNTKNRESDAKESPKANPASSPVAKKGSSESLKIFQHSSDDPGVDRNSSQEEDAEEKDQVKEGLRKAEEKKKHLEEEETVEEEGEKMEEEIEGEGTKEEVLGERGSEGEQSGHIASMLSNGRASVDIFKEGIEEDATSAASENSADFDFEE